LLTPGEGEQPAVTPFATSESTLINAYLWNTPNGQKLSIALEELGMPYALHLVDISKGDQRTPAFRAVNPNGKIPAIVDSDGPAGAPITVFESGAILLYLAEKTGRLLPKDPNGRWVAIEWLQFQVAGVGPMFGQAGFFKRASEQVPMAIEHFTSESHRLLAVLDERLGEAEYLAGEYSVADIATWPWVTAAVSFLGMALPPNVARWQATIAARPAVQRGLAVCKAP